MHTSLLLPFKLLLLGKDGLAFNGEGEREAKQDGSGGEVPASAADERDSLFAEDEGQACASGQVLAGGGADDVSQSVDAVSDGLLGGVEGDKGLLSLCVERSDGACFALGFVCPKASGGAFTSLLRV